MSPVLRLLPLFSVGELNSIVVSRPGMAICSSPFHDPIFKAAGVGLITRIEVIICEPEGTYSLD